jgi:hypothetical protein
VGRRLAVESPYAIAKHIGESLSSLLHLKSWIGKAGAVVFDLAREAGLLNQAQPCPASKNTAVALELAYRWPAWLDFTHAFSRVLYPKRFPLLTPHTILTG